MAQTCAPAPVTWQQTIDGASRLNIPVMTPAVVRGPARRSATDALRSLRRQRAGSSQGFFVMSSQDRATSSPTPARPVLGPAKSGPRRRSRSTSQRASTMACRCACAAKASSAIRAKRAVTSWSSFRPNRLPTAGSETEKTCTTYCPSSFRMRCSAPNTPSRALAVSLKSPYPPARAKGRRSPCAEGLDDVEGGRRGHVVLHVGLSVLKSSAGSSARRGRSCESSRGRHATRRAQRRPAQTASKPPTTLITA